jgi:hypothetical protein
VGGARGRRLAATPFIPTRALLCSVPGLCAPRGSRPAGRNPEVHVPAGRPAARLLGHTSTSGTNLLTLAAPPGRVPAGLPIRGLGENSRSSSLFGSIGLWFTPISAIMALMTAHRASSSSDPPRWFIVASPGLLHRASALLSSLPILHRDSYYCRTPSMINAEHQRGGGVSLSRPAQ